MEGIYKSVFIMLVNRHFEAPQLGEHPKGWIVEAKGLKTDPATAILQFKRAGLMLFVRKTREGVRGFFTPWVRRREKKTWRVHIHWYLLAATFLTTLWAGYWFAESYVSAGGVGPTWLWMLSFSLGLLIVLGGHELSHKFTADRNGIDATPPFFIPVPPEIFGVPLFLFGTLGAVIRIKSPIPDRNALIEMGASGPIISFLFCIPFLVLGLALSTISPIQPTAAGTGLLYFGDSVLTGLTSAIILGPVPRGYMVNVHPLFFVGWLGVVVTMLNLIPMGQLDGAHVVRALAGPLWARRITFMIIGLLCAAGYLWWPGWYLWAFIGFMLARRGHPGALDEVTPISRRSKLLALAALLILLLCFLPMPLRIEFKSFVSAAFDAVHFR